MCHSKLRSEPRFGTRTPKDENRRIAFSPIGNQWVIDLASGISLLSTYALQSSISIVIVAIDFCFESVRFTVRRPVSIFHFLVIENVYNRYDDASSHAPINIIKQNGLLAARNHLSLSVIAIHVLQTTPLR